MLIKVKALFKSEYFGNTTWMFIEKLSRMLFGLFVGIWLAKYLGPENYGSLSLSISIVGLLGVFATLGLDSIVVRDLVKTPKESGKIITSAFFLKIVGAILVIVLSLLYSVYFELEEKTLIVIISTSYLFQAFNVISFYFQSKVKAIKNTKSALISITVSNALRVFCIMMDYPLISFAILIVIESTITSLIMIYLYYKERNKFKYSLGIDETVRMLKNSSPLMLSGIAFMVFSNIDNIMLGSMIGSESVGIYNAAYRLATVWYFIPGVVLGSFMPRLVESYKIKALFDTYLRTITSFLLFFSLILATLTTFLSEVIINVTFGSDYQNSSVVLILLVWANVLIFFNSSWNQWMIIENKSGRIFYFHVFTAVVNVVANYFLIPKYHELGAAYALLISLLASNILYLIRYKEMRTLLLNSVFPMMRVKISAPK